jgi:hypothetical protein
MTASLLGSMLVYWAAHVWSDAVDKRIRLGEAFRPRDVLFIARREWPLVEAAALPSILLGLAWAGAWSRETGARLALAAALVQVIAWGFAAGRRGGGSRHTAVVLAAGERSARGPPARRRAARPVTALLPNDLGGSRGRLLGIGVASLVATVRRRFLERRCDDHDSK